APTSRCNARRSRTGERPPSSSSPRRNAPATSPVRACPSSAAIPAAKEVLTMAATVGDFLLERLGQWGVRRVFGYPGDGINGILSALGRADGAIEFVQVRHEEEAAFMACGHAKFTGEVGVCLV